MILLDPSNQFVNEFMDVIKLLYLNKLIRKNELFSSAVENGLLLLF